MSTRPELMPPLMEPSIFEIPPPLDAPPLPAPPSQASTPLSDPRRFAEEQMRHPSAYKQVKHCRSRSKRAFALSN
jgi:hypothetical protein